jgi:hypothetical protein
MIIERLSFQRDGLAVKFLGYGYLVCRVDIMVSNEDRHRIFKVFNRISESILDEASDREGLPRIVREATDVLGADAGTLAIPRQNQRELDFEAYYDRTQGEFEEVLSSVETVKPGEGITGEAYTSREILEVTDEDTLDLSEKTALGNLTDRCSTILSVPLIVRSESVGVVNFFFGEPVNVRSQKEDLLKAVARQSGIAIRQGRKIRELQETNRRLRIRAATDPLTGLPNQGRIMDVLNEELERSSRYSRPLSTMMLDVDRFKLVNDTTGTGPVITSLKSWRSSSRTRRANRIRSDGTGARNFSSFYRRPPRRTPTPSPSGFEPRWGIGCSHGRATILPSRSVVVSPSVPPTCS